MMSAVTSPPAIHPTRPSAPRGGHLVTTAGVTLPLRESRLDVYAAGGVARATLRQTFVNPHSEPLTVSYQVPLPEHAAVSGYSFVLDGVHTVGRVERREDARRAFEDALLAGRTGALLEEDRSTLFEQELGNLPAGAEVTIALTIDQRLTWLASGEWEWRFPTVVAPRYLGAEGSVPDAARIEVAVAEHGVAARATLALTIGDTRSGAASSPSHALVTRAEGTELGVSFDDTTGAMLDRDVVIRWPVASAAPGITLRVERPAPEHAHASSAFGLLTIVPPRSDAALPIARDLIVLLDTSGSMGGEPLAQAVAVVSALIESLGESDRLELIEFSDAPRRWHEGAVHATAADRKAALQWLAGLRASGSTEMRSGILAALQPLGTEAQRQVLLVSDGLIGAEQEICAALRDHLPASCRFHVLGVGHGVNRSLTAASARAGRGVERIVAPGEDPAQSRDELLAATVAPLLVDLCLEGDALEGPVDLVRDLMGGVPTLVPLQLRAEGGSLRVTGRTREGVWVRDLHVDPTTAPVGDGACAALYARERVTTLDTVGARDRDRSGIDAEIERLGLEFQIATPRTSWVATSADVTVDPAAPTRRVRMPHELAAGLSAEGLGLRQGMVAPGALMACPAPMRAGADLATRSMETIYRLAAFEEPRTANRMRTRREPAEPEAEIDLNDDSEAARPPSTLDRLKRSMWRLLRSQRARSPRRLGGRVVSRRAGELIVEATLDPAGDWTLTDDVVLELADGTKLLATVDVARSTASFPATKGPQRSSPGIICRLTLICTELESSTAVMTIAIPSHRAVMIDLQP
jgi:Ca-activated chloride channel family protein